MGIDARPAAAGGMNVGIRRVEADDVPYIVAIERAAFSDPWAAQSFEEALDHPAIHFACASSGAGDVLGYVVAWFVADQGEIANLAVAPSGWGAGIGRALLQHALDEGERRGAEAVFLEVRDSNERARRLYESSGFEEIGRRRRYYNKPVEDAIVLRRTLKELNEL
jgi:[ribosomal protein S18]-alanine N-acetyltransferase